MALTLSKLAETNSTITLGWTPPAGVGGYVVYANGQPVSVATRSNKDGSPRSQIKFSKASPGPPFQVAGVCRSSAGAFRLEVGTYPDGGGGQTVYPSNSTYPAEASP
jgi:hypothetical protein